MIINNKPSLKVRDDGIIRFICAYIASIIIIKCTLYTGANLNVKDSDGMTALHHAAANGHLYAAQLLLNLGAKEMTTRYTIDLVQCSSIHCYIVLNRSMLTDSNNLKIIVQLTKC